jgi:hypothetical protein
MSLLEVVLASALLIVVVLVITGLVHTTDRAYLTEIPLRERQVRCQAVVDSISQQLHEARGSWVWLAPVLDEPLPAPLSRALLFASARDADGRFASHGVTLEPCAQKYIACVPLNRHGSTALVRYTFDTLGPALMTSEPQVPRISASASTIRLQWVYASGGSPVQEVSCPRESGVVLLADLERFSVSNPKLTAGTEDDFQLAGGGTWAPDMWQIGVTVRFRSEYGYGRWISISVDSSINGRN